MHILDTIDRAIAGRCPCGAQPRPGSAYCGPDCEPTHVSDDTDTRPSGPLATPARWRPGLAITGEDDFGYEPIAADAHYDGPYFARLLRPRDADGLHLRLDDGDRWVGHTIDRFDGEFTPATIARMKRVWRKLERKLSDPNDAVAVPVPPDLRPALLRDVPRETQERWEWWCDTCRRPLPTARWHGPIPYHFLDGLSSFHRITRRAGDCSAAQLLREVRERAAARTQEHEAARVRLGIPNWERRCRDCHRYGEPQHGVRLAAGRPVCADDGTVAVAVELCQVCPHCNSAYPGPPLIMTSERRDSGEWHYRLRAYVGDRKYGHHTVVLESRLEAVHNPADYLRREWDRMEAQLLRRIADDEPARREPNIAAALRDAVAAGQVYVAPAGSDLTDPNVWQDVGTTTRRAGQDG